MAETTDSTALRQVWRERPSDTRRVSLHVDEWQRHHFALAHPELVPEGLAVVVVIENVIALRVRSSHLGLWE
jgi:hypothetical protein